MAKTCRACLGVNTVDDIKFVDIFSNLEVFPKSICLADALMECTSVQISKDDSLSKSICSNCVKTLHVAQRFRNTCLQSDIQLRRRLSTEIKTEDSVDQLADDELKTEQVNIVFVECSSVQLKTYNELSLVDTEKISHKTFPCNFCPLKFEQKCLLVIHTKLYHDELSKGITNPSEQTINSEMNILPEEFSSDDESGIKIESWFDDFDAEDTVVDIKSENDLDFENLDSKSTMVLRRAQNSHSPVDDRTSRLSGPFVCVLCEKVFDSNTSLKNHTRCHSGERPFQCEHCGKNFKQKIHLTVHRKSHTTDKNISCKSCSKNFITITALKTHIQKLHADVPQSPSFSCKQCPKKFLAKHLLVKHLRIHTGETPYMCELCGKTFREKPQLTIHIRQHTGEKPYSCNICDRRFKTSTERRIHKLNHSDELPHQCSYCDMRFKWKVAQWRHMRQHTGERPNKCTVCDKAFIEGSILRRHMRVHTGERPHVCKICGNGFKENTHLKTHMKVHKND